MTKFPHDRTWRKLFVAAVISKAGDQLTRIALVVKAYEIGGDVGAVTAVMIAQSLPLLVAGTIAGIVSDRYSKRNILILADFVRAVCLVGILFSSSLSVVILLTVILAAGGGVFRPVEATFEADLLNETDLISANVFRVASQQLLSILGPAVTAVLLLFYSIEIPLLLDASSYLVSIIVLLGIYSTIQGVNSNSKKNVIEKMWPAIKFIKTDTRLLVLFYLQSILILLLGVQGPVFYEFVIVILKGDGSYFSVLMTALGVGAFVGSLIVDRLLKVYNALFLLVFVLGIDAASLYLFSISTSLSFCSLMMLIMGLIAATYTIVVRTTLQLYPPENMRGQILGLAEAIQGPLFVCALLFAGFAGKYWGPDTILGWAAVAEAVALVPCYYFAISTQSR